MYSDFCSPSQTGGGHVWLPYEPNFQRILSLRRAGRGYDFPEIVAAIEELDPVVLLSAGNLLRRITGRDCPNRSRDAAQSWWTEMLGGGFDRCLPGRPAHRYGYAILHNICADLVRALCRERAIPPGHDVTDERSNPLRQALCRERQERVRRQVDSLPSALRDAMISQFWHDESGETAAERANVSRNAMYLRRMRAISEHKPLHEWKD